MASQTSGCSADTRARLSGAFLLWMACHTTGVAEPQNWTALRNKPVVLVADDWCPQHCEKNTAEKGYVVDIVSQSLTLEGVPFTLQYLPWTRAMRMVERAEADGLLTPTVQGFPQYRYHRQAVGYQQYCFYVDKTVDWKFTSYADLRGRHIVMLADSGLGPLETYVKTHKDSIRVSELRGENDFAFRLFKFLASKRADTVVVTSDVFEYSQVRGVVGPGYQSAGCLPREKMAVGLTHGDAIRSDLIGKALDSGIEKLRKSGKLASILAGYGMKDWDPLTKTQKGTEPATTAR